MSPRRLMSPVLGLMLLAGPAAPARAHFLFTRIGPAAEGGRRVELFFSEHTRGGDPQYVAKVAAGTKLWAQVEPGRFEPLPFRATTDRLVTRLGATGAAGVVGVCNYGVLARPGQPAFLLRYYPKAIAGPPEKVNVLERCPELAFEIAAKIQGDRVTLTVLREGAPVPRATIHVVDGDLEETVLEADAEGAAVWTPTHPGTYAAYTRQDLKKSGTHGDRSYEEIREFATLALTWPLSATGADPEAVALFQAAVAARAQWVDFPGFAAELAGSIDGRSFTGTVRVGSDGSVTVESEDADGRTWARKQLESIVMHRLPATQEDSAPIVRFADDDTEHPLGRLLSFEGGQFASSYRIQDGAIRVVNRAMGRVNLTIVTLDQDRNVEGRTLPRSYTVQTWNATTGESTGVETVRDTWIRVGSFDLPARHVVTKTTDAGLDARSLVLSSHHLGVGR